MDDLEAVTFGDGRLGPRGERDDLAIVLDGYAVTFEGKFDDEVVEAGGLRERGKGAGLAVEN